MYQTISYDYCDTLDSIGHENEALIRNCMVYELGLSGELVDQVITNSSVKNLPASLRTQALRNQSRDEIMMFKGNLNKLWQFD